MRRCTQAPPLLGPGPPHAGPPPPRPRRRCATVAFGLGIDNRHVRLVLIENYRSDRLSRADSPPLLFCLAEPVVGGWLGVGVGVGFGLGVGLGLAVSG